MRNLVDISKFIPDDVMAVEMKDSFEIWFFCRLCKKELGRVDAYDFILHDPPNVTIKVIEDLKNHKCEEKQK